MTQLVLRVTEVCDYEYRVGVADDFDATDHDAIEQLWTAVTVPDRFLSGVTEREITGEVSDIGPCCGHGLDRWSALKGLDSHAGFQPVNLAVAAEDQ